MSAKLATTAQKNYLQERVLILISDTYKIVPPGTTVQAKRYLTNDNQFVYLTHSQANTPMVAPIKIQVFQRVDGGVRETIYRLYGDHRLTRETNLMIFGQAPDSPQVDQANDVTEDEAATLCTIVDSLNTDNERIQ